MVKNHTHLQLIIAAYIIPTITINPIPSGVGVEVCLSSN